MQFLYSTGEEYSFMNMETYEQVEINKKQIENEAKYLKEWIDYHLIVGVDHFYLYNKEEQNKYRNNIEAT